MGLSAIGLFFFGHMVAGLAGMNHYYIYVVLDLLLQSSSYQVPLLV
jgi:hypothetical protein